MTEEDWQTSTDPGAMLAWLAGRFQASQRKARLFVCAACRQVWARLQPTVRQLVEAAEDEAERDPLEREPGWVMSSRYHDALLQLRWGRLSDLEEEVRALTAWAMYGIHSPGDCAANIRALCPPATPATQAELVRDLFGNPFRKLRRVGTALLGRIATWPVDRQPGDILLVREWLTWQDGTIAQLAHTIHEERAFERMPYLADALEEAGCADPRILDHVRRPEGHSRGCWVLDALLGKD